LLCADLNDSRCQDLAHATRGAGDANIDVIFKLMQLR
jgi:hypothetical protein